MRRLIFFIAILFAASGCEEGDWLGPMERGLRAAFDGWDMWQTEAVRPYEDPMPPAVLGTVPTHRQDSFETIREQVDQMSAEERKSRADLVYRRFCHHCHGPSGDGRIIVGESLDIAPADLRSPAVTEKTDKQLFEHLESGGELMVPISETMSREDMFMVLDKIRSLGDSPSKPHFSPRFDVPLGSQ